MHTVTQIYSFCVILTATTPIYATTTTAPAVLLQTSVPLNGSTNGNTENATNTGNTWELASTMAIANTTPNVSVASTASTARATSTPNSISLPYDVLKILPNPDSNVTTLPCWHKSASRSGRITLKRKDFLRSSSNRLLFRVPSCQGESYFAGATDVSDFSEDLYIDIRLGELDPLLVAYRQEYIDVLYKRKINFSYDSEFDLPVNYMIQSSNRHDHVVLTGGKTGIWSTGPQFEVSLYRFPLYFFNASNNFTLLDVFHNTSVSGMNITKNTTFADLNDPCLMEKELMTIDYTVVLRPRGPRNIFNAAQYFLRNRVNDMHYCASYKGFVPKQMCSNIMGNSLNITACPRDISVSAPSLPPNIQSETASCLDLIDTIAQISPVVVSRTTSSPWIMTTWRYNNNDDYYDYRMIGVGVALALTFLSLSCAVLKYCCKHYAARRHMEAAVNHAHTRDFSRRNSDEGPRVYGVATSGVHTTRGLDAPPSYEEVIRSGFSSPITSSKGSSNDLCQHEETSAQPTILVVGVPSRTVMIDNCDGHS
ncbi:uncharacterized protein LOC129583970 [Paramacrobiotus metropolitanus]|uniref:uncharacterized protein LOC129583970 n=1 Tax=Paramacrobiotus metropolitanus TaxID=2943436 RepID=UPI0024455FA1|nr:uncharacterized protein LOC129583970 [Paramacrobiotus metropolitanus]